VARRPVGADDALLFGLIEDIAGRLERLRPVVGAHAMQQQDVEVVGVQLLAIAIDHGHRIVGLLQAVFRHQPVAIARNAGQRDAQHVVHAGVVLRSFEETNAVVVGVADQARELLLAEFALHFAAEGARAEGQAGHLDARVAERHPVGSGAFGEFCRGGRRGAQARVENNSASGD